ncbi:hypothetical protein CBS101457_002144 [Exobasidium rhododendri]|nr:hypothetical protein CBS101457_002144 [Exobasidium rhododendri]
MNPLRRIQKEITDIQKDKDSSLTIQILEGNVRHLIGTFPGPEGSPYQGGLFKVDIDVVEGYPFQPLKMKFITKVYHPNISSASGAICLDILTAKAWSPVLTLRSTLVSLRSLLCSPEPNDPQDAEVAAHYKADLAGFESTAKFWTECYAKGLNERQKETLTSHADPVIAAGLRKEDVEKFVNMGFDQAKVIETLSRRDYRGKNTQSITDDDILNSLLD